MENLNEMQKKAAIHRNGPLLIIAGAGSGKTKTLTNRIANLIRGGIVPTSILAITFTNKAAEEMKKRVGALLSVSNHALPVRSYPFVGTFHSWGARVLKMEASILGRTPNFSIFDNDDTRKLIKDIVKSKNIDKEKYNPAAFEAKISKIKNEGLDPSELKSSNNPLEILAYDIYQLYENELRKNNAFDFDDLISKVVFLFQAYPEVLRKYQSRYSHILVDEYQDVNSSQYKLVRLLAASHGNLAVVGDDAQSIYAFRGSDFRNFLNFDKDWPDATIIKLEENYRSSSNIVAAASALIKNNSLQKPKSLWTEKANGEPVYIHGFGDESDEAYFIVGKIIEIFEDRSKNPEIAILYRTNAQSRALEQALIQNGIPYKIYGGLRFYDRMEIKDLLACLQYASNPSNALSAERIRKNFNKKEAETLLLNLPRKVSEGKIIDLINFVIETTNYIAYLEKSYKNARERIENVNEFIVFAGSFNDIGLASFLEQVSLVSSVETPNGRLSLKRTIGAPVALMTVHASKGLEFNQVFVAGCNEGLLPHERSLMSESDLEEERRLMYVAITRARELLTLVFHGTASRFLYEIPTELTVYKDHSSAHRSRLTSFEDEDYIEYD